MIRKRWLTCLFLVLGLIACQAQEEALVADVLPTVTTAAIEAVATQIAATEIVESTQPPPPTATVLPTVVMEATVGVMETPSSTDVVLTEAPTEIVVEVVAQDRVVFGRTADGVFFIGAEDAPVTVIDYSDFL